MKEKLLKKLEELEKTKNNYISQIMAINGAIQCLRELLKEEETPKESEVK